MSYVIFAVDILIIIATVASSVLWLQASRSRLRRISLAEELDAADFNRIVVAINRAQMLSARAAGMTGAAALLAAIRLSIDAVAKL